MRPPQWGGGRWPLLENISRGELQAWLYSMQDIADGWEISEITVIDWVLLV